MESVVLSRSPGFITAHLSFEKGARYLKVFVSPIVPVDGTLFAPVQEVFDQNCVTVDLHDRIPDQRMAQHETIIVMGEVHECCPGDDCEHICKGDSAAVAKLFYQEGKGWFNTDHSLN